MVVAQLLLNEGEDSACSAGSREGSQLPWSILRLTPRSRSGADCPDPRSSKQLLGIGLAITAHLGALASNAPEEARARALGVEAGRIAEVRAGLEARERELIVDEYVASTTYSSASMPPLVVRSSATRGGGCLDIRACPLVFPGLP